MFGRPAVVWGSWRSLETDRPELRNTLSRVIKRISQRVGPVELEWLVLRKPLEICFCQIVLVRIVERVLFAVRKSAAAAEVSV